MRLQAVWTSIVQVFNTLTFSSLGGSEIPQVPLISEEDPGFVYHPGDPITQDASGTVFQGDVALVQDYYSSEVYHPSDYEVVPLRTGGDEHSYVVADTPVVGTPKNPQEGVGGGLNCHYPTMQGWEPCYSPSNRKCWLKKGTQTLDINTDYENPKAVPVGRVRKVLCSGPSKTWVSMLM